MGFRRYRDIPHEFIITMGDGVEHGDIELFFGPKALEGPLTAHFHYDEPAKWEDVAVDLEIMPSKSEAKRNGWSGEIPSGYSYKKRKFSHFYFLRMERSK